MTDNSAETAWKQMLADVARPEKVADLARFFKTGPGEYAEGDRFIGVMVPDNRAVARRFAMEPLETIGRMLDSSVHEHRLSGFLALVRRYQLSRKDPAERDRTVDFYLSRTHRANNWDLVDLSTGYILGEELVEGRRREQHDALIASDSIWDKRVAIVANLTLVRKGRLELALADAEALLTHPHDLLRKATGWILREVGKKDIEVLRTFLAAHIDSISSITLSYATERMRPDERLYWRTLRKSSTPKISKPRTK